jgi:hypothetical protein
MANYLLSVMYPAHRTQPPPDELEVIMRDVEAVRTQMQAAGVWVFSGGLHPASTATVVEARDNDVHTTDGPFAETKEHLGGITIVDVPDLDDALRWAEQMSRAITVPIEVRPFYA